MVEIAAVADLPRHVNKIIQRSGDGAGGGERDHASQDDGYDREDKGNYNGPRTRGFIGSASLIEKLGIFMVHIVQIFSGAFDPGGGVLLQVENLQFGDGGIAFVHVLALFHQGRRELVAPSLLALRNLLKTAALLV